MAQVKITFYERWNDTIKGLPDEARLEVYDAIVHYAFDGSVSDIHNQVAKAAFGWIKSDIDKDNKHKEEVSAKRRLAGRCGGAPTGNGNARRNAGKEQAYAKKPIQAHPVQGSLFPDVEVVEPKQKPNTGQKPQKHKYAPDVLLTDAEYQKLSDAYGEDGAQWMITKLDNYKAARGTTYKSDYRAILNWVVVEYEKQKTTDYGTTEINRRTAERKSATAKQQRDKEFAEYIAQKLTGD